MCDNKSLCRLFVALNIFTATVLVQGYSNSSFYYTRLNGDGAGKKYGPEEEVVHLERMLRDIFGGFNNSTSTRKRRESRFIHYDLSDDAVNLGMEFSVHFLSIPVKRTIDTAMGFMQVIPKTTVNLNALFIGILLTVVGVVATGVLDLKTEPWQTFGSTMRNMMLESGMETSDGF